MESEQPVICVEQIGRSLDSNMKFSTKVSILAVSLAIFSVGIRELIFEYQNVLNNEEIEKISTLYSKQAIFMPPEIPAIKGVEEIDLTYEYLFSQFDFELEFNIKEVVISENFAYVHSNSEGTITIESSETEETSKNQEIFILIKEGNDWKISRYIFNSWS
jgi:ketosteroid isomerase-like protein